MNRMKSGRGGGYNDNDNYMDGPRHLVHMRGLPYRAIEDDIAMVNFNYLSNLVKCSNNARITKVLFNFIVFQTFGTCRY